MYSDHADPGVRIRQHELGRQQFQGQQQLTSKVSPHDRLELDDLRFADEHRAALELVRPVRLHLRTDAGGQSLECGRDDVVLDDVREPVEPKDGELREELAFAWDALQGTQGQTTS